MSALARGFLVAILGAWVSTGFSQIEPRTPPASQIGPHLSKQQNLAANDRAQRLTLFDAREPRPAGLRSKLTGFGNAIATKPSDALSAAPGASGVLVLLFGVAALVIRKRRRH